MKKSREVPLTTFLICVLASVHSSTDTREACLYGFYCNGMYDPLLRSRCENSLCVCSGEFAQSNCLPNVSQCVIKEGPTTHNHPASVCTRISSSNICSTDFNTYHCFSDKNPNYEVHVLGSYQAASCCGDVPESVRVQIIKQGELKRKIVLVLASTRPVAWHLDLESEVNIERVILICKTASLATVSWSQGSVKIISKVTNTSVTQNEVYGKGSDSIKLLQYLTNKYGSVTSFTGRFQVDNWRLRIGWPFDSAASEVTTSTSSRASRVSFKSSSNSGTANTNMYHSDHPETRSTSLPKIQRYSQVSQVSGSTTLQFSDVPLVLPSNSIHPQVTSSFPDTQPYSWAFQISTSIPNQQQIAPSSITFFQAFGTMEFHHISGMDYYANGTLHVRVPVITEIVNSTLLTQTVKPSKTHLTKSSSVKVFSSVTDLHKISSRSPNLKKVSTTSLSSVQRTSRQSTAPSELYQALSSTPVLNSLPTIPGSSSLISSSTITSTSSMVETSSAKHYANCGGNRCHEHAVCSTVGSRSCSCKPGFQGNGLQCTDIDECKTFPCPTNSNCKNTVGSYNCPCQQEGSCRHTRLVGSAEKNEGRVEVLHNGEWGTICDVEWGSKDSEVACRDAGYPYLAGTLLDVKVPDGSGRIWLSAVNCNGTESKLSDCPHPGWGKLHGTCKHSDDVGVKCVPTTIRLAGSDNPDEGRVEIFYDGQWGTVCDNGWDIDDADVVCYELGFDGADWELMGPEVPDGTGKVWLENVECDGEDHLKMCDNSGWGTTTCGHDKDAGVKCTTRVNCDFELNTCSWRNEKQSDDFDWERNRGSTPTLLTGPTSDNSPRTIFGAYIYIETSGRKPGQKAWLVSPVLSAKSDECLHFFYHMQGSDIAQLNVDIRRKGTSTTKRLWNLSGTKKDKWVEAKVPLNYKNESEIIFEAVSGQDQKGDIALDDIRFVKQPCSIYPTGAVPDTDECKTRPCHVNATCTNVIGSYTCKCNRGYTGNGTECTDIDECAAKPCHQNATCRNTEGSFECKCNSNTKGICDDAYRPCGLRQIFRRLSSKIIGGNTAVKGSWPWQAAIFFSKRRQYVWCGGALINHEWVLTAAHCFDQSRTADGYTVILGEHDVLNNEPEERTLKVQSILIHPGYHSPKKNYDIALLHLSSPVNYTANILPICLADNSFPAGTRCVITGWGTRTVSVKDYPQFLQEAVVPTIKQANCKDHYRSEINITPYMLCAGYTTGTIDACQGDSGGPLMCQRDNKWYLVGLTSFGYDCAAMGYPGVYANVAILRQWVLSQLNWE